METLTQPTEHKRERITVTATQFNSMLKQTFKKWGMTTRVRVVNSYKFPTCYVEVSTYRSQQIIPNDLRLLVCELAGWKPSNTEDVHYGNIGKYGITLYANQWVEVLEKYRK